MYNSNLSILRQTRRKQDLAVNLSTKNILISLKILKTLRAKTFLTLFKHFLNVRVLMPVSSSSFLIQIRCHFDSKSLGFYNSLFIV